MSLLSNRPTPRNVNPAKADAYWLWPLSETSQGLLSLNGRSYSVVKLEPQGYRLVSDAGEVYDLDTADEKHWKCSCPDFIFNRDGKNNGPCKHVLGLKAALEKQPAKREPKKPAEIAQAQRDKAAERLARQARALKAAEEAGDVRLVDDCPECAGNGCVPESEAPTAAPVKCQTCNDPGAQKATYRSLGDAMKNAPEEFAGDNWDADDPRLDEMWTVLQFPDEDEGPRAA